MDWLVVLCLSRNMLDGLVNTVFLLQWISKQVHFSKWTLKNQLEAVQISIFPLGFFVFILCSCAKVKIAFHKMEVTLQGCNRVLSYRSTADSQSQWCNVASRIFSSDVCLGRCQTEEENGTCAWWLFNQQAQKTLVDKSAERDRVQQLTGRTAKTPFYVWQWR